MENRTYYYARVSTKEQHLDRQIGMTALFILHHIADRLVPNTAWDLTL